MAADWIKMRTDLAGDPAVIRIRRATGLDADAVVGKLHRLWSWADAHTADGFAAGLDAEWVDEFAGCAGFAASMASAGWLASRFPARPDRGPGGPLPFFHPELPFRRVAKTNRDSPASNASPITSAVIPGCARWTGKSRWGWAEAEAGRR